jgi:hypothetical protein
MLPFGIISFIEFPVRARKFSDFPDGRIVVGDKETGDVLFYQIDIQNGLRGSYESNKCDQITRGLVIEYLKDLYDDINVNITGMDDMMLHLKYCIDPPSLKGRPGTTQLMRGVSSGDRGIGTVSIDLIFGRVISLKMVGWKEGMVTRPEREGYYSGTVMFAKKKYAFSLKPINRWHWNRRPSNTPVYRPDVLANAIHFCRHMTEHDAALQMKYWLYRWFPMIKDYDMLGEFVFDSQLTPDEVTQLHNGLQGKKERF